MINYIDRIEVMHIYNMLHTYTKYDVHERVVQKHKKKTIRIQHETKNDEQKIVIHRWTPHTFHT